MCPSCHHAGLETSRHALGCPAVMHITSHAAAQAESALLGMGGFDALSGRVCFPPAVRAQRIESVAATACEDDGPLVGGYAMALALLPGPQPADKELAAGLASWLSERKGAPGRAGLNNPSREELRALSASDYRVSCLTRHAAAWCCLSGGLSVPAPALQAAVASPLTAHGRECWHFVPPPFGTSVT